MINPKYKKLTLKKNRMELKNKKKKSIIICTVNQFMHKLMKRMQI
jgi:hypothetical protein